MFASLSAQMMPSTREKKFTKSNRITAPNVLDTSMFLSASKSVLLSALLSIRNILKVKNSFWLGIIN